MLDESDPRIKNLDAGEVKLAKTLEHNNMLTREQFNEFLELRESFEKKGKRYLGDILVERGFVRQEDIDEFFVENNEMYIEFLDRLIDEGFLREEQKDRVMADEGARTNVVSVMEKLGIMTKESFIKLFSKRVNSLRLGDWLLTKRKIDGARLKKALEEQGVRRLDDYLVHRGIVEKDKLEEIKKKLRIA